ncbi:hypothetical protein GCM10009809_39980 [Isoptericola hypogeus]|uniref:Uncharacterized protein n=1 Tax=Isoptericola hypogeus TaxID=300179 RepID=A0ABP4W2D5_9MICO
MTRWKVTDPDGVETVLEAASTIEACEKDEMFACALAGCPDAFGWTYTNLETGRVIVPEDVRARIEKAGEPGQKPREFPRRSR